MTQQDFHAIRVLSFTVPTAVFFLMTFIRRTRTSAIIGLFGCLSLIFSAIQGAYFRNIAGQIAFMVIGAMLFFTSFFVKFRRRHA